MYRVTNIAGLLEIMQKIQGERTQKEFAQTMGVSPQYLNDVYNSRREPGPAIYSFLGAERCYRVPESTLSTALAAQENTNASKEIRTKEDCKEVKSSRRKKR
jgi:transcriptional regulator with XRE-family HTH domain